MDFPQLKKKYGLPTAIAMVVGVVAGSGVFFKAEAVLTATGGNVRSGIAAWLMVGLIMIICANTFSVLASRYERATGLVDFAQVEAGRTYSYCLGWFMATIYYPSLTAILAWVPSRYLCILFGVADVTGGMAMLFSAFFLVMLFATNALAPMLAGKLQVATTVIKLVPLVGMAIIGTIRGMSSGMLARNFYTALPANGSSGLLAAAIAVAFAYEGWIIAISINGELKNAKRNMPVALTLGTLIIVAIYLFYYLGLTGVVTSDELMASGQRGVFLAFETVFGEGIGIVIFVLLIISCISTCNGLSVANCRGMYALAARGHLSERLAELDPHSNTPLTSSILSLVMSLLWLVHFYGSNIAQPWFPDLFCFDSSELPIITLYAFYIPIFFMMMKNEKDLHPFPRYVLPGLGVVGCLFMVTACIIVHRGRVLGYLVVFLADLLIGLWLTDYRKQKKEARK